MYVEPHPQKINGVLFVLTQNEDIRNFHVSLTLNKEKLISDILEAFSMPLTHFFILFGMRKTMACFGLCISPVLIQNEDIWNLSQLIAFEERQTNLILGKLLVYHCVKYESFFILFGMRKK